MSEKVAWDMSLAYRMVRQRDHALTDRQRKLQWEQGYLEKEVKRFRDRIAALQGSVAVVEKAGGDATNLRAQIDEAQAELGRLSPRHDWLEQATSLIAANLRLLDGAHSSLHWLNFENETLAKFDRQLEPEPVTAINARTLITA